MFKGLTNMRIALYIASIVLNATAIYVRSFSPELGEALQYGGGALAAFTGVVALTNVEKESSTRKIARIVKEETGGITNVAGPRCTYVDPQGQRCWLLDGHTNDGIDHAPEAAV